MGNKGQLSPEEMKEFYFDFQSLIGISNHMGGLKATRELAKLCRISKDKRVLEVSCGVGATSCYLARRYGCSVVGVDISERMVERSREKAERKNVEDGVEFMVADAQDLPFGDAAYDAVISESVTAFVEDEQKAMGEYTRVTKPEGYVGLNECTWIKAPPPRLAKYMTRAMGAEFSPSPAWKKLLEDSGLREVVARTYEIKAISQWANEIRQMGLKDLLKGWCRFFSEYARSSALRDYVKQLLPSRKELITLLSVFEYFGYGISVGRKSKR